MRLRITAISILFGALSTAICWFTLQSPLKVLIDAVRQLALPGSPTLLLIAQVKRVLPFYLGLDFVIVTSLVYLVLEWTVGRPLAATEQSIANLSDPHLGGFAWSGGGGPLLSRLQTALRRLAEALQSEQTTTRAQLEELKASNSRLMRAQAELVASDRLATVGKLAAGVAHEVGNPLSGILGYLSLMQSRAKESPEQLDLVQRIEGEVHRIDGIVRSLLELGRPSRGKPGPVDVASVIGSCVKLIASGPEFRKIVCSTEVPPGLYASCEAGPLSQVVINLLLNAAQAMGGEGALELSASSVAGGVEIRVRDHGPGFSPELQERLFEPFFTTKAAGKGTGLGLAVSRHLIELIGGEVIAANHPDGGALFTVRLAPP